MRTKEVYDKLKEIAGDTWIEPSVARDEYIMVGYNEPWWFCDIPTREMEFYRTVSENFEKEICISIYNNDDGAREDLGKDEDYVSVLRVWGSKSNSRRNKEKYPDLEFYMSDTEEDGYTLEECWKWFISDSRNNADGNLTIGLSDE